ncbi:uncharacterized protein LOC121789154 [Salvia splendens]|uniref:uncharacterized protein LOC121789154 n=1 Tax=Salvia splendens TaxID=180675 RepID=UPI001C258614|nr:uncharacterized protein LOC121789154 [Salvia splendens]
MDTPESPPDWVDGDAIGRRSVVHGVPPFIGDDGCEGPTPPDLVFDGSETEDPLDAMDGSETQPPSEGFYVPDSESPSPLIDGSETEDPAKGFDGSETEAPFDWPDFKPPSGYVNLGESEAPLFGLDDIGEGIDGAMQPAVEPNREYIDNEKAMLLIMFPCMKDIF